MTRRYVPLHGIDARRYHCAMFPWLRARNIHHTAYGGPEKLWFDLLPLSLFAHWILHGIAGGTVTMPKSVTRQNRMARALPLPWLWRYPNPLQRCLHCWCRIPAMVRWGAVCVGISWVSYEVSMRLLMS